MAKGLGIVTGNLPELKNTSEAEILNWASELIRVLNLRDQVRNAISYGWQVENLSTEDKVIDASAESTDDVRTILATLIKVLKDNGTLGG